MTEERLLPLVLKNLVGKPFPDVRFHVWHLLALIVRSRSAAYKMVPSAEMRDLLLDFTSETGAEARIAKHTFVVALQVPGGSVGVCPGAGVCLGGGGSVACEHWRGRRRPRASAPRARPAAPSRLRPQHRSADIGLRLTAERARERAQTGKCVALDFGPSRSTSSGDVILGGRHL